jgi:integrase
VADLTDPQRYGEKFTNQLEKVRTADIAESDREKILEYVRHLDGSASVNTGTIVSRLNRLRLSAERCETELLELDESVVDQFLFDLNHEYDLSEGTVRNYRKALRAFFEYIGREWWDAIKIGASPDRNVDPNELLTMEEIDELLEAADNSRDKALVAIMADSGLRIGAIASLRVRDINFSGAAASVTINEDANVKGASGTTPLTWSEGHVASWLDVHPRRVADAPLFHVREGYFDAHDGDGSLDYQYLARRVRNIAAKTDIDTDRVNTHNFRKSAISRWIRDGMSEQAIKHRAHWDVDTEQFDNYSGVRDEELNDQILAHYGLEGEDVARPDLDNCPRCGTPLRGTELFCPSCAGPLTDRAVAKAEGAEDDIFDSIAADDLSNADLLKALRSRFQSDPEMRQLLSHAPESYR